MRSGGRWSRVATTAALLALVVVPSVVVAILADDPSGLLAFVALVLFVGALLHGVRPGSLPGRPDQNVARVVVLAASVLALLVVLAVAFVAWLWTGLCGGSCDDAPSRGQGLLLGAALAAAAVAVVAGGLWGWVRIGRARDDRERTGRGVTLLPAAAVGLVALVSWATTPGDPRRPVAVGRATTAWAPCPGPATPARPCVGADALRTAATDRGPVAVWRSADRLLGAAVRPGRPARVVRVATLDDVTGVRPSAFAVTATGPGSVLVGWVARRGLRLARMGTDGRVRPVDGTLPGPSDADDAAEPAPAGARELALVSVDDGVVAFAVGRVAVPDAEGGGTRTAVRVLPLDAALRPRGAWRTVTGALPAAFGVAAATVEGRAAVDVGGDALRTVVSAAADGTDVRVREGRVLVPGPGGARESAPPGPRDLPADRRPPVLDGVLRDAAGVRSAWTTAAPRSDDLPARVRQQWVVGPGPGTPSAPWADGLLDSRLVPTPDGPVLVGLRPTEDGRRAPASVVVVAAPR